MKLGFLAMSGVRAHNPELTAFGLTLPGFVERNRVIASLPSLGLLTLAALTPPALMDAHYVEVPALPPGDHIKRAWLATDLYQKRCYRRSKTLDRRKL
jgi:hypothetical protein